MTAMTLFSAVRRWIRRIVGASSIVRMIGILESRQKRRQHAVMEELNAIRTQMNRIEQKITAAHIDESRGFVAPVLDWDTVQAMCLHELEQTPKEGA